MKPQHTAPKSQTHVKLALSLAYRICNRIRREIKYRLEKLPLAHAPTFSRPDAPLCTKLSQYFSFLSPRYLTSLQAHEPRLAGLVRQQSEATLAHRFDLLGSGPTVVAHGTQCQGVDGHVYPASEVLNADAKGSWLRDRINRSNLKESQRVWKLIDPNYVPIDWQLDFKSGYRWREDTWYRDIQFGKLPGVDVKVPLGIGASTALAYSGSSQPLCPSEFTWFS